MSGLVSRTIPRVTEADTIGFSQLPAAASIPNSFAKDTDVWYLMFDELPGISPLKYGENILQRLAKPLSEWRRTRSPRRIASISSSRAIGSTRENGDMSDHAFVCIFLLESLDEEMDV